MKQVLVTISKHKLVYTIYLQVEALHLAGETFNSRLSDKKNAQASDFVAEMEERRKVGLHSTINLVWRFDPDVPSTSATP